VARGRGATGFAREDRRWQPIIRGRLAAIDAEPVLYAESDSGPVLVRIRIRNLSPRELGMVADDYWKVVFPNQWGFLRNPYRTTVDEPELRPSPMGRDDSLRLLEGHRRRTLLMLAPAHAAEYFREFAGRRPVTNDPALPYLIISLSGRLWVTDGVTAEELTLIGVPPKVRDLVIPAPLSWQRVPARSRVIRHP
jgi:hypothetical protein